ncbi:MAG: serine/threonine-protein kinase [Planctomycetaceae bacterium]
MVFAVDIDDARSRFPEYEFVTVLTPSEQKAAFHVRDQSGQDLCLKIVSPSYTGERLQREIFAMQQISHPNIVSLKEYTYSSTPASLRHFLVEEFIQGRDLADELKGKWARPRIASVFALLMDGLAQLNSKGIVHRDLKPTNIRLRSNDSPVIIDFGLSRHLNLVDLTATSDGAQIGTPLYFAPEQFEGTKHHIDHRTDLFAAGVIIYQALTGMHPFYSAGMGRQELQKKVTSSDDFVNAADFASLPASWQLIVKKLLAKDRAKRVNSADQAAQILRKLKDV